MDFNKLTIKSGEAVAGAQELARRAGNPELTRDHLTVALLEQELPRTLLSRAGADPSSILAEADARLRALPSVSGGNATPQAAGSFRKALDVALDETRKLDDDFVSVEHLMLALEIVPREALLGALKEVRGGQRVTTQDPEGTYEATGLVTPARTPGGTRLYSEEDVARLILIQQLTTKLGLNLAGVEHVLRLEDELRRVRARMDQLEAALRTEISETHRQYRREVVLYRPQSPAPRSWRVAPATRSSPATT